MTWSHGRRIRQIVQLLALFLYLYLVFAAVQQWVVYPLADLFFRYGEERYSRRIATAVIRRRAREPIRS